MVNNLNDFASKVENFNGLSASELIDYFAYYLVNFNNQTCIRPKQIEECYGVLNIPPYSNVSSYLSSNSKKVKGKPQKYLKKDNAYCLSRQRYEEISRSVILNQHKIQVNKNLRDL